MRCYGNVIIVAFLIIIDCANCIVIESESCPKVFKYKETSGVWSGQLSVPLPKSGLPIHVELELAINALLTSKYAGLIELSEVAETALEKIIEGRLDKVEYDVRFPLPYMLPVVQSVKVNGQEICQGIRATGSVVTYIKLEHEFPTNYYIINSDYIKSKYGREVECGEFVAAEDIGSAPEDEKWPWLVAILIKRGNDRLQFQCSGTLLSHLFVLTAAHCFSKELKLSYGDFVLYLGKHDLSNWGENNSEIIKIKTVYIHPQFKSKGFNADLALIQMARPVLFGSYIKPMCLWQGDSSLEKLVDKDGLVIGWGKDESGEFIKPTPRMVKLSIVNQEDCLRSQIDFHYITSSETFCAGARNGKGPCHGDSGSAIIYPNPKEGFNRWHLRGIISLSLVNKDKSSCDNNLFTVFTDVAKFQPWLSRILKNRTTLN